MQLNSILRVLRNSASITKITKTDKESFTNSVCCKCLPACAHLCNRLTFVAANSGNEFIR